MKKLNNVDWHVTDRCNLRCVSCGHMCPLVDYTNNNTDRTIEDAERDFSILYEKTNNGEFVDNITLTGGECTLNKNLPEIIKIAYKYFPNKISIWSNCINLALYTSELISVIKEYNLSVNITVYRPNRVTFIDDFFNRHEIPHQFYNKKFVDNTNNDPEFFNKFFSIDEIEDNKEILNCYPKFNCCQLINQKLYVCQYMAFLHYLDEYFKNDIGKKIGYESSNKYIDLTQVKDYQEISDYIEYYNEDICQHCLDKWMEIDYDDKIAKRIQPWRVSNKEINEWIIQNVKNL